MEILAKSRSETWAPVEGGRSGPIKKKKKKCGLEVGARRLVDQDTEEITSMLIPVKILEQIIRHIVSKIVGKWGPLSNT